MLKYVKKLSAQQYKTPEFTVSVVSEEAKPYRLKTQYPIKARKYLLQAGN